MFLNYPSWTVEGMRNLHFPHKVLEIRQLQHQQRSDRIPTGPTDTLNSAVQQPLQRQSLQSSHC